MKRSRIYIAISLILICSVHSFGQNEKELVIKTAHALQTNPAAKETIKMREKALLWVIKTDEVNLIACGGVFSLFSDKKNKNGSDMTAAYLIGMAAFKLENPSMASDENASQLAGIETALKTYELLIKDKPKTRSEKIDSLVGKRDKDELAAFVNATDCGKK